MVLLVQHSNYCVASKLWLLRSIMAKRKKEKDGSSILYVGDYNCVATKSGTSSLIYGKEDRKR